MLAGRLNGLVCLIMAASVAVIQLSCGEESPPSACDPNSPDYLPEVISVVAEGSDVVALASDDVPIWRRTLQSDVGKAVLLDLSEESAACPPGKRIVCSTKATDAVSGSIVTFDERGNKLWTYAMTDTSPYPNGHIDRYNIIDFEVSPINSYDKSSEYKIIATASDVTWFPNRIFVLDLQGSWLAGYWHPGDLGSLITEDIDGCDPIEIVFCGLSNTMPWYWLPSQEGLEPDLGDYCGVVGILEGDRIWGCAAPYGAVGVPHAYERWYAFAYDTTAIIISVTQLKDHNSDGQIDVEAWTNTGWGYYIDSSGDSLIGLGRADAASYCIPRLVIFKGHNYVWYVDPDCPWGSVQPGELVAPRAIYKTIHRGCIFH